MPLPIGPILFAVGRVALGQAAKRGAAAAVGRAVASRGAISSSQFSRGAAVAGRIGRAASKIGRAANLTSAFLGSAASGAAGSASFSQDPVKRQGLDTYGDGVY